MAKEYKVGADLFLPVRVKEINTEVIAGKSVKSEVQFSYVYCFGKSREGAVLCGGPNLLLTAEEVAQRVKDTATQCDWERSCKELEATNAKLNAEIVTLKSENESLKSRVGKYTADIQDMAAEIHFLKEKSGKQTEEATKHAHVVLNDGTELAFTQKDTQAFYRDDVDMLFISDGDGVIAGFNRGDKPTNFAYFF